MTGNFSIKYSARKAPAEAYRVDELKAYHDLYMTAAVDARKAKDRQLIEHATEIRIRAERRLGELTRTMPKARNRPGPGRGRKGAKAGSAKVPALSDQNIDKHLADRARRSRRCPSINSRPTLPIGGAGDSCSRSQQGPDQRSVVRNSYARKENDAPNASENSYEQQRSL